MGGSLHAGHGDHIEGMLVHWSRHRANMSAILCQDFRLLESWLMRAAALGCQLREAHATSWLLKLILLSGDLMRYLHYSRVPM